MTNIRTKIITFLSAILVSFTSVAQIDTANVTVDFSQSVNVNSMSGFLIGNILNSCNSLNMLTPLAPKLLRTKPTVPLQPNATYHWLTSNTWGFTPDYTPSGVGIPPYDTLSLYFTKVAGATSDFVLSGVDSVMVFDIWNEPNSSEFWAGTELQYHQTFATGVNAVRSVIPNARIAGPSTASFDTTMIKNLLDYCVANSIKFDVLSWHELLKNSSSPLDTADEIREVKDHLIYARANYLNNPAYDSVGLQEIHINEFVGRPDQYLPAEYLAYLSALELGGANMAASTCWFANDSTKNCDNCSLDGFVDPNNNFLPRSKWWVNKFYTDNVNARVTSTSNNTAIVSLAAINNSDTVSLLIGHNRQTKTANGTHAIRLNISNLPFSNQIRVQIQSLPNQDETVLITPPFIYDSAFTISGNFVDLTFDTIPLHDVWYITITNENNVGISNSIIENDIVKIYPNPLTDNTTVELQDFKEQWGWTLFNSIGQIVQQIESISNQKLIIKKENLTEGIYIYQIKTKNGLITTGKLIIK